MYASCLGIYSEEDLKKAIVLLKENSIEFEEANPLTLFEQNEAEYRLTEMYDVVDQQGNIVTVPDKVIAEAARSLANGEYFDYDWIDELISRALDRNGLMLSYCYKERNDTAKDLDVIKIGEKVMLPFGPGEDLDLAKWLDNKGPTCGYEVVQIDKDNQKCWIKDCPYSIPLDRVTVFQNIGF